MGYMKETKEKIKDLAIDPLVKMVRNTIDRHPIQGKEMQNRAYYKAFYDGNQLMRTNPTKKDVLPDRYDDAIPKWMYVNKINMNGKIATAKMLKKQPIPIGVPTSSDRKDELAAKASTKLWRAICDDPERGFYSDIGSTMLNAWTYGTGYLKVWWDPRLYARISKEGSERQVGDVRFEVYDDFSVFVDPSAKKWRDARYITHRYMADVDSLKEMHPKFKRKIKPYHGNDIERDRYSLGGEYYNLKKEAFDNHALVCDYWERPCENYPKGRLITTINHEFVVTEKDNKNPYSKFGYLYSIPFVPFFWDKTSDRFHGNSAIRDQIPMQKAYNLYETIMLANAMNNASNSILVPKGSGIDTNKFGKAPGAYEFNAQGGAAPVVVGGSTMPSYIVSGMDRMNAGMQDVSGVHAVSMGQIPERGSRIPASALKMIMESEAEINAPNMRSMTDSLKIVAIFVLKLVREYYKEKRYYSIMGETGGYEIEAFADSSFHGSVDFKIQIAGGIDSSVAAKVETTLNLADRGILQAAYGGERWALDIIHSLEYGGFDEYQSVEALQRSKATWFIEQIKENKEVPDINEAYNTDIFTLELQKIILSLEFEEYDEETKSAFLQAYSTIQQNKAPLPQEGGGGQGPPVGGPPPPPDMAAQSAAMSMGGQGGM